MDAMSAFSQRVHAARLTKKEAAVADYNLNNFSAVCYMSTGELGRNLGVSDATVIELVAHWATLRFWSCRRNCAAN